MTDSTDSVWKRRAMVVTFRTEDGTNLRPVSKIVLSRIVLSKKLSEVLPTEENPDGYKLEPWFETYSHQKRDDMLWLVGLLEDYGWELESPKPWMIFGSDVRYTADSAFQECVTESERFFSRAVSRRRSLQQSTTNAQHELNNLFNDFANVHRLSYGLGPRRR